MAILKGGFLHGKVGNLIYYTRNGVSYVRSVPKPRTTPPTPAQLAQQLRMKRAMEFLAPLAPVLENSFKPANRHVRSGLNWATKQVLLDAIAGEYPDLYVDPGQVKVSWGGLPRLRNPELSLDASGLFTLHWIPGSSPFIDNNEPVFLLIYNETQRRVVVSEGLACRGDGQLTLQVAPEILRGKVHGYGFLVDRSRRSASESVFLGTLVNGEL
ncbi:hypothetical protein GCM10007415_41840 [Parapedobacter pyrenivorans]|uniref:Uncharacterized protein n=1 Tax=Parapedobacter pyrenivorans TaxID=1305674 RepID=A0A917I1E4_9SPHI|nr:DUF6266 family protein [Parapedobacter pyrenivorans]GGH01365.1 hypothetical protein GCM10007415_41840 [Parapedobacter pyrenivorans]